MKVRTSDELQDFLDGELARVKKDFTTLKFMVSEEKRVHIKYIMIKSSILLLYANWEGHVKRCASAYLTYLNTLGIPIYQMQHNFMLLMAREKFNKGFSMQNHDSVVNFYEYMMSDFKSKFLVKEHLFTNTKSNLNFENFKEIINCLGFDLNTYELKENLINEKLVNKRHAIAHGEYIDGNEVGACYDEVKEELLEIIASFNNMISNSVATKAYLQPSHRS